MRQRFIGVFGKTCDELLGSRFIPERNPEGCRTLVEYFKSLTRKEPTGTREQRIDAPDGSVRWVQWSDTAIFGEDGAITEYQSVGRDITSLKLLDESLRASDTLYRSTISAMVDGVHVIDRSFTIILINNGLDSWKGLSSPAFLIYQNLFTVFPFLDSRVRSEYENVFASGEMMITDEAFDLGRGTVYTETRKIPILIDGKVEKIVTIVRDVSGNRRADETRQNMNRLLEDEVKARTQELEAIVYELDSFTYTVSHDLRGPIRAVDGFAHILELKAGPDKKSDLSYYIGKIHENIRLMDQLIEDLLSFSRMSRQQIERTTINMKQLAEEVVREIRGMYPLVRFDVRVGDLPPGCGDAILVREIFVNLISNAMKFSQKQYLPRIEIGYSEWNGTGEYWVRDNGIGFDMQYADKIFDVFQRLHPAGEFEGTGVGLAIVNRVIIRHGGYIRVISEEGAGATFSFTLGVNNGAE